MKGAGMGGARLFAALALVSSTAALGAGVQPAGQTKQLVGAPEPQQKAPGPGRKDAYGDPLPPGALARLGTVRLRHGNGAALAFAPGGASLLTCGADRTVRVWEIASGRMARAYPLPPGPYTPVTLLSPEGRLLAFQDSGAMDRFSLWDIARGRLLHRLPLGEKGWHRAAFSPDGKILVTAQPSGQVRAWDVATGRGRLLGRHEREVRSLSFAADGTLVSLSPDRTLRFWDLAGGRERSRLPTPEHALGAAVSPDARTVALWSFHNPDLDKGVQFWDAATGKPAFGWAAPDVKRVSTVAFTPDGKAVLIGTKTGILFWDPTAARHLRTLPGEASHALTVSPGGKTAAAFDRGHWSDPCGAVVRVWDLASGAPHPANAPDSGHLGEVAGVAFAPDGLTVATACPDDGSVRLWEAATGRPLIARPVADLAPCAPTFSPDGKYLFVGTSPAVLRLDAATGQEVGRYALAERGQEERHHLLVLHLADDGRTLHAVSQTLDGKGSAWGLHAWEVATGKRLNSVGFAAADLFIGYSRFSPDGRLLVLPSGSVRDAATGAQVFRLPARGKHPGTPVGLSPDGALVAVGEWGEVRRAGFEGRELVGVQVWELATLLPVARLKTPPWHTSRSPRTAVGFSRSTERRCGYGISSRGRRWPAGPPRTGSAARSARRSPARSPWRPTA